MVGILFTLMLSVVAAKSIYLQVYQSPWLSKKAANQYERSVITIGKRGTIFDRKHRAISVSNNATSIGAHPLRIANAAADATALAKILNLKRKFVYRQLSSKKSFVWIKRKVSPQEAQSVRDLNRKGLVFKNEKSRVYPNKMLAAQVIGFCGIDGNGLEGIEYLYDDYLRGNGEKRTVIKDALGRQFSSEKETAGNNGGRNLILTIDRNIQFIAESALDEAVTEYQAESGMAIVMAPDTGAVLALAHVPLFNANAFKKYRQDEWRNRAITDPFEPGSTMKIFSAAAAIETRSSTPKSIYFCENGAYRIGKDTIHDTHAHGWLSLKNIVKYSSNIGIVKVSESTGPAELYKNLRAFGFGRKTGIDCPGETAGSLAPYRRWSQIDTGAISFGQGISVSAIQLTTAVSAIANGGILMQPYIVQAITDSNGGLVKNIKPRQVRRVVSVETARTVARIMKSVIDPDGTGINAALDGYTVSGKTGTAQKSDENGTYAKGKYTASFVGFAPSEHPAVAVIVVIDEPKRNHYGGVVAAPVFRKIAQATLRHLNISPSGGKGRLTVSRESEVNG